MSVEAPAAEPVQAPSLMDTPVDQLPAAVIEQGQPPEGAKDDLAATHTERETAEATEATRREALTDDERAAEDAAKAEEAKAAEGAPEAYEDFVAPEGMELNAETLDSFKTFAKDANLSQAAAQSLVDMATGLVANAQEAQAAAFAEQAGQWREATLKDPDFGGTKLAENLLLAVRARDQFGTPALKELLDASKLGDHPEVVRFFVNVGKATSEDSFVPGGTKTASAADFYNHPTSQKS